MSHNRLTKIFEIFHLNTIVYLDQNGKLFWSRDTLGPLPFNVMPKKLQVHFLMKFIQDYELAERTKMIKDPVVCIELYIKGKFMNNEPLGIN